MTNVKVHKIEGRAGLRIVQPQKIDEYGKAVHVFLHKLWSENLPKALQTSPQNERLFTVPSSGNKPLTVIREVIQRDDDAEVRKRRERELASEQRDDLAGYSPYYGDPSYKIGSTSYEVLTASPNAISALRSFVKTTISDYTGGAPWGRSPWVEIEWHESIADMQRASFYRYVIEKTTELLTD